MKRGKFIVFEGISGTGKETQANLLKEYLSEKGVSAVVVYHPSPELKETLLYWRRKRHIDNVSEAYFLLADRYNRVKQIIEPALRKGEWVISLRNFVSALVYQAKTGKDREYLTKEFAWFEPRPDYLFYFDITPQAALERITKRHRQTGEPLGKFESLKLLTEKRRRYQAVLRAIPHITIDASQDIGATHKQICQHVNTLILVR